MFKIEYKIIENDEDDFTGQNGFFRMWFNDNFYGDMYGYDLESIMDTENIYNWFERIVRVAKELETKNCVILSDVESYKTWIQFLKYGDTLSVSIVLSEKQGGSKDIEYKLNNYIYGEWKNQIIDYYQFKCEVFSKYREYISCIKFFKD